MNDFEKTLARLDKFCNEKSIKYAVIGGIAVIKYGYERTTKDIDITVLCELEEIRKIHKQFAEEYSPVYEDSLNFFEKNFVLPVKDKVTRVKVDVAAGLTIFDDTIIQRRKRAKLGEVEFYISTLEDLIVYKLFANRYQDLADAQILLDKNKDLIEKNYLIKTIEKFRELGREDMIKTLNKFLSQ